MTGRGPASLHHHHGTVPHRMLIADGPETRTIMTAEKAWQDLCGKLFRIQPLTRRTLGPPNSGRGEKLLVGRLTLEWLPQPTEVKFTGRDQ